LAASAYLGDGDRVDCFCIVVVSHCAFPCLLMQSSGFYPRKALEPILGDLNSDVIDRFEERLLAVAGHFPYLYGHKASTYEH
jgi:hypothetical protein